MADFGDFLAGFSGQLLADRTKAADQKSEADEWERRQRLMKKLEVEQRGELNALERKDGNTFQDESGAWVTQILDGGGNPIDVRPATAAEKAKAESTVLAVDMDKDEFAYRGTKRKMDEEEHRSQMAYRNRSLDLQERAMQLRAADASAAATNSPDAIVDSWLNTNEGKMAVKAYAGTLGRVQSAGRVRGGSMDTFAEGSDEEKTYVAYEQLKEELLNTIRVMPPEQRPKTESEFRALLSQLAGKSRSSLDRYTKPK